MDVVSLLMPAITHCLRATGLPAWALGMATKAIQDALSSDEAKQIKKELEAAVYAQLVKAFPNPNPMQKLALDEVKKLLGV